MFHFQDMVYQICTLGDGFCDRRYNQITAKRHARSLTLQSVAAVRSECNGDVLDHFRSADPIYNIRHHRKRRY